MRAGNMKNVVAKFSLALLIAIALFGSIGPTTSEALAKPQNVGVGRACTWKEVWSYEDWSIMTERKSPKTDIVVAEWMEPCRISFSASKSSTPRIAVLQLKLGKKWTDMWTGDLQTSGKGSVTLNDDSGFWADYCDYRKFSYRIVARGGKKAEVINNNGLLFIFSETYYDCDPMDTDQMRAYYNLGADPDKNACWNVLCKSKGKPVLSHESRSSTGVRNAAGEYKCRWYKFYIYKDGSQAPSELVSEWWGSNIKCR
jgi:hypothetical protein